MWMATYPRTSSFGSGGKSLFQAGVKLICAIELIRRVWLLLKETSSWTVPPLVRDSFSMVCVPLSSTVLHT